MAYKKAALFSVAIKVRIKQEKIFGLSIFIFAQNLWLTEMKNDNSDSSHLR